MLPLTTEPAACLEMGAVPHDGGVVFRLWAPNAKQVFVTGTFNSWSSTKTPLAQEKNGYWSAEVSAAKIGDEYRYLLTDPNCPLSRIDPYARRVTNSLGNGVIYDTHDFDWAEETFHMVPRNELVIYEMHIGTFNAQEKGRPGTFDSAIEKFPYLQNLGINAVEIMPVAEFSGDFSWGYDPSQPFAVESIYGGPDGFKRFVKAAHQHGIAVIVDVVYNHVGPSDLDLWQFDGWNESQKGGIYFYNDRRSRTPWGETRPDYGRPEVRQYIRDNAFMWLEDYCADGLRWDMIIYIASIDGNSANTIPDGWSLMQSINAEIQQSFPDKFSIAEGMHRNPWITKSTGEGGAGFHAQWDAAFVHHIRRALIAPKDEARDLGAVAKAIEHRFAEDAFTRVIYTESHDEIANGHSRVPEEIWPGKADSWFSRKRSTLGAALVLTSPGIPMLFEGQELLEDGWFHDTVPIDWSRETTESGILLMYRNLIALRRNQSGVTRGLCGQNIHLYHFDDSIEIIAFHRWDKLGPCDSVVIVANLMNQSRDDYIIGFPAGGIWKVRFNSDSFHYGRDFSNHSTFKVEANLSNVDGLPYSGKINVGAYSVVIYSQDTAA